MMDFETIRAALTEAHQRRALWQGADGRLYIANHQIEDHCPQCGHRVRNSGYRVGPRTLPIVMTTCPNCDTYRPEDDA